MKNKAFKGFINRVAFTSTALLLISLGKYKIEKDSDEKPFTKIIKNIGIRENIFPITIWLLTPKTFCTNIINSFKKI